ncbi:hypothetical protein [Micromonospora sp. NPDC049679]|uniref:hypothetical protein n=1 Tax=Micromonospora sp. NPDC049679 TaxID=3155920 RepID=UPI0034055E9C
MDPLGMNLALTATRRHVLSARPDAPIVPPRPTRAPRPHRVDPVRRATAGLLRRLADRVEPCHPLPG